MRIESSSAVRLRAGLLCLSAACTLHAQAADPDYEQIVSGRLAQVDGGEVVRLNSGTQESIALFIPEAGTQSGRAVVILHGMGGHADWPDVVAPLRRGLPARGWATFSIQLPVLAPGAPWSDYGVTLRRATPRISSAVACLGGRGYREFAFIGYGFGATAAAEYLAAMKRGSGALVGISMHAPPFLMPRPDLLDSLRQVPGPVLDLYGSRDHADILREADDRRLAGMQNRERGYEQSIINGADHDYAGFESELISRVAGWLESVVAPAALVAGDSPARSDTEGEDPCRARTK